MKTTIFTLTAMGLGLMAGITLTHHHQVGEMVARGGIDERLTSGSVIEMVAQTSQPVSQKPRLAASDVAEQSSAATYYPPRTDREDALLELLAEMRKEQKAMHKQMAEQNREVAELTFRVDTHSDSFKPLRTESGRPQLLDTPVGPQTPIDDDNLLPANPASRQLSP